MKKTTELPMRLPLSSGRLVDVVLIKKIEADWSLIDGPGMSGLGKLTEDEREELLAVMRGHMTQMVGS